MMYNIKAESDLNKYDLSLYIEVTKPEDVWPQDADWILSRTYICGRHAVSWVRCHSDNFHAAEVAACQALLTYIYSSHKESDILALYNRLTEIENNKL